MSEPYIEPQGVKRAKLEKPQKPIQTIATPPKQSVPPEMTAADEALDLAWKEHLRRARRAGAPQDAPRPKDWRPGQ